MSASLQPTVASVPSAVESATGLLALMTQLSGTGTDINVGSQMRTLAESIGAVAEEEGIANQALAFEALAYGAMSLFGISQSQATAATGICTFATSLPVSAAPNAPNAVAIPGGTLVQTQGGIQFATIANATLASGTASVNVGIIATSVGSVGNIASGAIFGQPLNGLGYPLSVTNPTATAGGANAGTQSQALALFTAKAASLGLSSPVAIADAVIGVVASGTGETVAYSSVYEAWLAAGSGAGSGVAGFTLFIDNGTGSASPTLLQAVTSYVLGNQSQGQSGYRPAGMPFTVSGVTPVYAVVVVSGVLIPGLLSSGTVQNTATSGVESYFQQVGFSAPGSGVTTSSLLAAAYQPQIAGWVADSAAGAFQSLAVSLFYSGSATAVVEVSGAVGTRVLLGGLTVNISTAPG